MNNMDRFGKIFDRFILYWLNKIERSGAVGLNYLILDKLLMFYS